MRRRAFVLITSLYPRAWRDRYGEELSDLCEEFLCAGETTQARLLVSILAAATLERLRALCTSPHRVLASSTAVLVALGAIALATNGLGLIVTAMPGPGQSKSELLRLGPGRALATSTIHEPRGVILLARVTALRGVNAYVDATAPGIAGVTIRTVPNANDPSLSCSRSGDRQVCTEAVEWCPLPHATWTVHVVKRGGPAGLLRVDLVVGARPEM